MEKDFSERNEELENLFERQSLELEAICASSLLAGEVKEARKFRCEDNLRVRGLLKSDTKPILNPELIEKSIKDSIEKDIYEKNKLKEIGLTLIYGGLGFAAGYAIIEYLCR